MMKKLLVCMMALALLTFGVLWSTLTSGSTITDDNAGQLQRFRVINESATALSKSGFIAENDNGDSLTIYIEAAIDGSDVYFTSEVGDIEMNVPTGKVYVWRINSGSGPTTGGLDATGFTGTWAGADVGVAYGGTGVSALTNHFMLIGSGTDAITLLDVTADGSILVGAGAAADPVALAAFSSSTGDVVYEAGGLEDDISAYTGLIKVTGQVTSNITDKAGLEGCMSDVTGFAEASGDTYAGQHDFSGAEIMGINPFKFEGTTTDDGFTIDFVITDPTIEDKKITLQDHDGIVVMDITACWDLEGTNLSITDGVLNASLNYGDVSIGAANYMYLWATDNTENVETDNWRVSVGAADLVWEVYNGVSWDTKLTHTP